MKLSDGTVRNYLSESIGKLGARTAPPQRGSPASGDGSTTDGIQDAAAGLDKTASS